MHPMIVYVYFGTDLDPDAHGICDGSINYKRPVKIVILVHLTYTAFNRMSPIEIRLVRPALENSSRCTGKTQEPSINFINEERQLK